MFCAARGETLYVWPTNRTEPAATSNKEISAGDPAFLSPPEGKDEQRLVAASFPAPLFCCKVRLRRT